MDNKKKKDSWIISGKVTKYTKNENDRRYLEREEATLLKALTQNRPTPMVGMLDHNANFVGEICFEGPEAPRKPESYPGKWESGNTRWRRTAKIEPTIEGDAKSKVMTTSRALDLSLKAVSHTWANPRVEDGKLFVEITPLDTKVGTAGHTLRTLLEAGIKLRPVVNGEIEVNEEMGTVEWKTVYSVDLAPADPEEAQMELSKQPKEDWNRPDWIWEPSLELARALAAPIKLFDFNDKEDVVVAPKPEGGFGILYKGRMFIFSQGEVKEVGQEETQERAETGASRQED